MTCGDRSSSVPQLPFARAALALAAFVAATALADPADAARACPVIDEDARQAQAAGDLEALKGYYTEAHDPAARCEPLFLAAFGRDVALAHIDQFLALMQRSDDPAQHVHVLQDARNYGEPWQLLAMLANVEAALGNHEVAASYYQQVVRELQVASRGVEEHSAVARNLPTPEQFEQLYQGMSESALLARTFSPPAATRGENDASGLFPESYRGYIVEEVPLPVQFQFDSTRFTSKGEQVAAYLLDYLLRNDLPRIKLIGHTDPKGDADYNLGLSVRRAEAVREYLEKGGYTGAVAVDGRGESEPFQPADPARFANDVEAKHQLDRRVELLRNPG